MLKLNQIGYYDLNVQESCFQSDVCEFTLETLFKLGYRTIAVNQVVDVDANANNDTKKKKKKGESRDIVECVPPPVDLTKINEKIKSLGFENVSVINRLTIIFSSQDTLQKYVKSINYKKYDILGVIPTTVQALGFVCGTLEADILSFDPENKFGLKLNRKTYTQLVDKGYHMELTYGPAIQDSSKRKNLIHLSHGYIPTGSLTVSELQNKMSLYLLSQLVYGISLVHRYQTLTLQHFSSEIARGMMRCHREEPVKRKTVDADEDYDEDRDVDGQGDIPAAKRKRASKRASSVLDLNDPRSYVSERPNRASTMMEPLFGADDMFQVPGLPEVGLEPAEEFMKMQEEVSNFCSQDIKIEPGEDMQVDISLKDVKVSVGRYDDWQPPLSVGAGGDDEAIENVRARTMSSHLSAQEALKTSMLFDDSSHHQQQPISPPRVSPPPPPVPVYRQAAESLESQDEFMLEPLPEFARPLEPKRRKRRLIYDDVTILTSEQISEQMKQYDDLVSEDEAITVNKLGVEKMLLNALFHPRPWHINYLNEDLMSLFDTALQQPKPTISFGEANKYGIEELRQRYWDRIGFDIQSWTSEALNDTTLNGSAAIGAAGDASQRPPATDDEFAGADVLQMAPAAAINNNSFTLLSHTAVAEKAAGFEPEDEEDEYAMPMKVSVAEISEFTPEKRVDSEIEARRFSSFAASRVSLPQAHFDDFDQPPLQNDDADLVRTSLKTAHELSQRTLDSVEATDLYQELVELAGSGICKFDDVMSRGCTKQLAARKFYNLLCLLKQKEVKVKQTVAYGEILVRLAPVQ